MKYWIVCFLCSLLTACATGPGLQAPEALLRDELFAAPAEKPRADTIFAVSPAMKRYLEKDIASQLHAKGRIHGLIDALYTPGQLKLDYESSVTRTAAEAFEARSGNCLSLVIMTAAFARELGLDVTFQSARLDDAFSRDGALTLRSGHVNLVLGPRVRPDGWRSVSVAAEAEPLQIDFLPPEELRGLRTERIDEATVLAMFMNNRAAEALRRGRSDQAYAWAREALRQDPGFGAAYNTLGVVYQRAGHLAPAAAAFEQLLARDPRNVAAMWNLAQVRQAQGRPADAAQWDQRRLALEPVPPFHWLQQGQQAMARGDAAAARDLFQRERRLTGDSAELLFWLAQAYHRLGEVAQAQQALQQAVLASPLPDQRERYAGKLAWLRAQATH